MENKKDYIVYDYQMRTDIVAQAGIDALNYVYSKSYPTPEKSFIEMCKDIKKAAIEAGHDDDRDFRITYTDGDKKYNWPTDFFYMPQDVLTEIWNNRRDCANIRCHWWDDMDALIDFLYKGGGLKEVNSPMHEGGENVRHCEDAPLVKDVIGEEAAEKLKDLLESYRRTYKWGNSDVISYGYYFMSTPNTNAESVKRAWKVAFNKDIEIPDDSTWIDKYEYADKAYNGEIETDEDDEELYEVDEDEETNSVEGDSSKS